MSGSKKRPLSASTEQEQEHKEQNTEQDQAIIVYLPPNVKDKCSSGDVSALAQFVRVVAMLANIGSPAVRLVEDPETIETALTNPKTLAIVKDAWKQGTFQAVRDICQPEVMKRNVNRNKKARVKEDNPYIKAEVQDMKAQLKATELSWKDKYQGVAWHILKAKIDGMQKKSDRETYARSFNVVQSSGMGKSRLIDEYSKNHVVIPICMRKDGETGYPLGDAGVRNFLCEMKSEEESLRAAHAFLFALFHVAAKRFEGIKTTHLGQTERHIAEQFWQLMSTRSDREQFYQEVVELAKVYVAGDNDNKNTVNNQDQMGTKIVVAEAEKLVKVIMCKMQESDKSMGQPTILLSFDEFHHLTVPLKYAPKWTPHFSLQNALRSLRNQPIVSVFLSTTGKYSQFIPAAYDPSLQVQKTVLVQHTPMCGLDYDVWLKDFPIKGKKLTELAKIENMARFGRPLFYARWKHGDAKIRADLLSFAGLKILGINRIGEDAHELTDSQILALLSMRIPLEFNAATLDGREEGFTQVQKHQRIAITVDDRNETCETVQPAEPLLAEGAHYIINHYKIDQAAKLLEAFGGPSIFKGDHGELICVLLWLLARDRVVQNQQKTDVPVIKVLDLIEALLSKDWHVQVKDALPSCLKNDADNVAFKDAFKDAVTYITQFIKVHDPTVINRSFLWPALARGAAFLCANNQRGLDLIIPALLNPNECLGQGVITAIIIQVKNDLSYCSSPQRLPFDAMNPYHIGFYNHNEQNPHPIIRMVFALAAKESNVKVMPQPQPQQPPQTVKTATEAKTQPPPKFTSYDIWCAKVSGTTFSVISSNDTFDKLLKQEKTFPRFYESDVPGETEARRQMHPMALSDSPYWQTPRHDPLAKIDVPEYAEYD